MEEQEFAIIPKDTLARIESKLDNIQKQLDQKNASGQKLWLTRREFLDEVSIGTTKFYELLRKGIVETRKVDRKVYVHRDSVKRYFDSANI